MTQNHVHFDENEIRAAVAKACAEMAHLERAEGAIGVIARMISATSEAQHLAVIRELNRESEIEDICSGVANVVCNLIDSFVDTLTDADDPNRAVLLFDLFDKIKQRYDGRSGLIAESKTTISPMKSGRA